MESGKTVNTCFTTDFFISEADEWRIEAWNIIKQRPDLHFFFITKRIDRFPISLPNDWGDGYDNVTIGCTVEHQEIADYRLPLFLSYPIKHRILACGPLLGDINLTPYLHGIEYVSTGGESGRDARECDFNWILNIREQCKNAGVPFEFRSTGSLLRKDDVITKINPKMQHRIASDLNINII
jgi:protein gp37